MVVYSYYEIEYYIAMRMHELQILLHNTDEPHKYNTEQKKPEYKIHTCEVQEQPKLINVVRN